MTGPKTQKRGPASGRIQVGRLAVGDQIMWGGRIARVTEHRVLTSGLCYVANDVGDEMTTSPTAPVMRLAAVEAVEAVVAA